MTKTRSLSQIALAATAALALAACSKGESDVAPPVAVASGPTVVAMAPTPEPVPAPAVAPKAAPPVVVAQNDRTYEQGRRDQQRADAHRERPLPPRADRDADVAPPPVRDTDQQRRYRDQQVAAAACHECGVVESIDTVKVQGETNGVGAVAGGVGGAVIGNRIAGGNNRTLGGIVGAVGGGLLGNAIEKHQRAGVAYDIHVRMTDGSLRTVRQTNAPAVGAKVRVEADGLHDRA